LGFEGSVQLISRHELVYVTATLTYRGTTVEIADVLVDTGAASTVINADLAADAGIYLGPTDQLRRMRGVGGHEHVFMRNVDRFAVGDHGLDGFDSRSARWTMASSLAGIMGMDFLRAAGARSTLVSSRPIPHE
jgi:predicted aspartyl protease